MKKIVTFVLLLLVIQSKTCAYEFLSVGKYYEGSYFIDSSTMKKRGDIISFGFKFMPSMEYKQVVLNSILNGDVAITESDKNFLLMAWVLSFCEYDVTTKNFRSISSVEYDKYGHILSVSDYKKEDSICYKFRSLTKDAGVTKVVNVMLTQYAKYIVDE